MVELVDTQDLKSCDLKSRAGSIPALSTKKLLELTAFFMVTLRPEHRRCSTSCESSSVGRARPCQGRGREFESRLSLKKPSCPEGFFR